MVSKRGKAIIGPGLSHGERVFSELGNGSTHQLWAMPQQQSGRRRNGEESL